MGNTAKAKIGVGRQLATCAVMCGAATVIILLFQREAYSAVFLSGIPLALQVVVGIAVGGIYWLTSVVGFKFVANRSSVKSATESYSRLDLSGWNPLWVALAAGFGEELLFRGALQPIIGIWVTSALFVVAHVTAYRFNALNKRVASQAVMLFALSFALGYIAQYIGLVAAILVHASLDIVGLYSIRRVAQSAAATA